MLENPQATGVRARLCTTLLTVGIAGSAGGLAVAATLGVSIPQLGINVPVPVDKAAGLERLAHVATTDVNTQPVPVPALKPDPIPAKLLDPDVPVPISPSIVQTTNGWVVSDGRHVVAVYAGAAGNDPSQGRAVVVRQDLAAGTQTVRVIDSGPTGALTIVDAPTGAAVETTAQTGAIGLRGSNGTAVKLHLDTNTFGR